MLGIECACSFLALPASYSWMTSFVIRWKRIVAFYRSSPFIPVPNVPDITQLHCFALLILPFICTSVQASFFIIHIPYPTRPVSIL